eukprot:s1141_g3.t2
MAAAAVSPSTSSQGEASITEQMGTSAPAPSQVASPVRQSLLLRGRKSGFSGPAAEVKAQTTDEMRTPDRRKTTIAAKETPKKRAAPKKRNCAAAVTALAKKAMEQTHCEKESEVANKRSRVRLKTKAKPPLNEDPRDPAVLLHSNILSEAKPKLSSLRAKTFEPMLGRAAVRQLPMRRRYLAASTDATHKERRPLGRLPVSNGMNARLKALGLVAPTELQKKVCKAIVEGRDVIGISERGKARLLAYLIPLLDRAKTERWAPNEAAIIVEPSGVLAEKVYVLANSLRKWSLRTILLREGGGAEGLAAQRALLRRGAHLVVATASQLRDLADTQGLEGTKVRAIVLDGAQSLKMRPRSRELQGILRSLHNGQLQTLVFTDASPQWVEEELGAYLREPILVNSLGSRPALPLSTRHMLCEVPGSATRRARLLAHMLDQDLTGETEAPRPKEEKDSKETKPAEKALIFVPSKAEATLLSGHAMLRQRLLCLHEGLAPAEQQEILALFRTLPSQILITTDAAVKDLELPGVPLVVHVSAPANLEIYLNRIGRLQTAAPGKRRTRRAAGPATSLVLLPGHQSARLRELEKDLGRQFEVLTPPSEAALRRSAVAAVAKELKMATKQYDSGAFLEDAKQQLEVHGPRLLAAALVLLERRRRGEEWRSPFSGRPRFAPLLLVDPYLERLASRQAAASALRRVLRRAAEGIDKEGIDAQIGRIELTKKGWLVDVPRALVPAVLEDKNLQNRGVQVQPVSELPDIIDDGRLTVATQQTRRRRPARGPRRLPLAERRAQRRQEFLYPSGRRQLFGQWLQAGKNATTSPEPSAKGRFLSEALT